MLSNKMTFSLMSLITLLVLSLVAGDAFAAAKPFEIKIVGRTSATYMDTDATTDGIQGTTTVNLKVESAQPIGALTYTQPGIQADGTFSTTQYNTAGNIKVYAFDEYGNLLSMGTYGTAGDSAATPPVPQADAAQADYTISIMDDMDYAMRDAKNRQLVVIITPQRAATVSLIDKVIIELAAGIKTTDPTVLATDGTDTKLNESKLVQHTITLSAAVDTSNLPKVVSIQRLREGSQNVVAAFQEERIAPAAFNVRIVLTEGHTADPLNAGNLVEVENGTASNLVVGTTFARFGQAYDSITSTDLTDIAFDSDTDGLVDAPSDALQGMPNPFRTVRPHPGEGEYYFDNTYTPLQDTERMSTDTMDTVSMPTGTDNMYRQYRVTITPHQKSADFDIKIRVKEFHDGGAPIRNTYVPPDFANSVHLPNGRDILTIPVKGAARDLTAGYKVVIPKDWIIPAGGYLIIAKDKGGSEIDTSGQDADRTNDTPRATHRTPAQMLYNVYATADLPNLATAFLNGVVVDVESQHPLVVSEVMWGEDTSLSAPANSQYIELYNPGGQYKTIDDKDETVDVNEALTLIFYAPNEFADVPARAADGTLPTGITDRIGTLDAKGAYWSPASKGQSGRSGTTTGELTVGRGPVEDPVPIVSMYRVIESGVAVLAADKIVVAFEAEYATDGQVSSGWMSSAGPKSANFDPLAIGIRHGTPGAATDATDTPADTEAEAKAKEDKEKAEADKIASTGTIPKAGHVYISEVMFAGGGVLPQWIELANGSATEDVNLSGWTLKVDNAAADADVSVGASVTFTIPDGTMINRSRQITSPSTILIVTEAGRNNVDTASEQVIVLNEAGSTTEIDLINAGVTQRKYTLLSSDAFLITLAPPEPEKTRVAGLAATATAAEKAAAKAADAKDAMERKEATDMAGNLGADGAAAWALPMSEDGRSSIIRAHVNVNIGPSEPEDGMMMENWVLAAETSFAQPTHIRTQTYYGAMNDVGTPGFRAGGALPVELSSFRPARDKATGAVMITWSTESELNNAGFFIKRSNQKDGEFKVINAAMIAGAGTTSEKQFYTYTDTTAQPNVVYYYQIEDVSFDGNRQTLTRGIRLKGHVGAAGKATLTWGELKTSNE